MTPAEFATYVRYKTRTNSTTFTDAEILALMKIRQDELARDIVKVDEDILLIPQVASLVKDQREYGFPLDYLARIKRVEAKLDGSNWLKLNEIDLTLISTPTDETNITYQFSNEEGNCFYDIQRKALYIYSGSIIDVSGGLKVWVNTFPAPVTDLTESTTDMSVDPSTTTHGIPRECHEIWARGVIIDFKESREKPIPLSEREMKYEYDKQKVIETLKHGNLDRVVIGHLPGSQSIGNDGQDY